MTTDKPILDPCCGSKMMWFDKENQNVLFADKRQESHILCDGRKLIIEPDLQMDFTDMPFDNDTFYLISFDPPHLKSVGANSWLALKYGRLENSWREVIKKGFDECMRVLKPNGVLIFKWNETQIKVSEIIKTIGVQPLFGHTSGRQSKTIWMCFMKISNP